MPEPETETTDGEGDGSETDIEEPAAPDGENSETTDPENPDDGSTEEGENGETLEMEEVEGPKYAIAKEDITDEHRVIALGVLSYMNMIKRKVEMDALQPDL